MSFRPESSCSVGGGRTGPAEPRQPAQSRAGRSPSEAGNSRPLGGTGRRLGRRPAHRQPRARHLRHGAFRDRLTIAPLCLIAGVGLLSLAAHTIRARRLTYTRGAGIAELTALAIVMAMALFWAAGDYSAAVGRQRASEFAAGLHRSALVVLYSDKSLGIPTAAGVHVTRCSGGDTAAYQVRYSGLVLLLNSNGQYVFLPLGWDRAHGSAYPVPKEPGIRVDYRPPGSDDADLWPTC